MAQAHTLLMYSDSIIFIHKKSDKENKTCAVEKVLSYNFPKTHLELEILTTPSWLDFPSASW